MTHKRILKKYIILIEKIMNLIYDSEMNIKKIYNTC